MKIAVERGRKTNKNLKLGICGEHGGDPASIRICNEPRARLCLVLAVPDSGRTLGGGSIGHRCEAKASANSRTCSIMKMLR